LRLVPIAARAASRRTSSFPRPGRSGSGPCLRVAALRRPGWRSGLATIFVTGLQAAASAIRSSGVCSGWRPRCRRRRTSPCSQFRAAAHRPRVSGALLRAMACSSGRRGGVRRASQEHHAVACSRVRIIGSRRAVAGRSLFTARPRAPSKDWRSARRRSRRERRERLALIGAGEGGSISTGAANVAGDSEED